MKKWMMVLAAAAVFSSCGRYDLVNTMDFGVGIVDQPNVNGIPALGSFPSQNLILKFSSRPGSQAGYINKVQVVRYIVDGKEQPILEGSSNGLNIFIPSGYICPGNTYSAPNGTSSGPAAQSCDMMGSTTVPGNAFSNSAFSLQIGASFSMTPQTIRVIDLVFTGVSATQQPFEVKFSNVPVNSSLTN